MGMGMEGPRPSCSPANAAQHPPWPVACPRRRYGVLVSMLLRTGRDATGLPPDAAASYVADVLLACDPGSIEEGRPRPAALDDDGAEMHVRDGREGCWHSGVGLCGGCVCVWGGGGSQGGDGGSGESAGVSALAKWASSLSGLRPSCFYCSLLPAWLPTLAPRNDVLVHPPTLPDCPHRPGPPPWPQVLPAPLPLLTSITSMRVNIPPDLCPPEPRRSVLLTLRSLVKRYPAVRRRAQGAQAPGRRSAPAPRAPLAQMPQALPTAARHSGGEMACIRSQVCAPAPPIPWPPPAAGRGA